MQAFVAVSSKLAIHEIRTRTLDPIWHVLLLQELLLAFNTGNM